MALKESVTVEPGPAASAIPPWAKVTTNSGVFSGNAVVVSALKPGSPPGQKAVNGVSGFVAISKDALAKAAPGRSLAHATLPVALTRTGMSVMGTGGGT